MGRHSSAVPKKTRTTRTRAERRPVYLAIAGLLVLSLAAVLLVRTFGPESAADGLGGRKCGERRQVQLSTTPEIKPLLDAAAKSLAGKDDPSACVAFAITAAASAVVAKNVASGKDGRPDLWVPDSSLWVGQADDGQQVPIVAVPSIASSPLVLVGRSDNFVDTSSWLAMLSKAEPALLDPLSQTPGALALLAIQAERQKTAATDYQVAEVVVPTAQRLGSMAKPYTDVTGLFNRAAQAGSRLVVPAAERSFVRYQDEHPDSELKAAAPGTGTLLLDYPLVVTAQNEVEAVTEAGKALASELIANSADQDREEAGLRDALASELSGGSGVGVISQLPKFTGPAVAEALAEWTRLSLSANSLAVVDVSGSMAELVGSKTRLQLTVEAAASGLKLFPDNASVGLWTFSTKIGRYGADFNQLVPMGKLSPRQRQKLTASLAVQQPIKGGSTGLYDTAIAAVQMVRTNYDPSAVNAVLLFTDGRNEDPGSPTLAKTLQTLRGLRDAARPVRIIAFGMGPDADATELRMLAEATGGQAYLTKSPADLKSVFLAALQSR
ncbi:VWA domain-containing protein [Kribbella sp. NPDC056861]|uniref:VWA domain-containing protein n=1 Tax=Kribbella sp. NPDC056861 TaxID=3154857 RepID=UPI003429815F